MLANFGVTFDKATLLVHFPKRLKRPRNTAGPASLIYNFIQVCLCVCVSVCLCVCLFGCYAFPQLCAGCHQNSKTH